MIALTSRPSNIFDASLVMEFFTKNRVANGKRMLQILESLGVSDLANCLPRYELAPELVKDLNRKGHKLPPDGFIPAFSLGEWCDREKLNVAEEAVDARAIPELIHSRGYRILEVEVSEEIAGFLNAHAEKISSDQDFFELLDLATFHLDSPLKIRVATRDR